VGWGVGWGGGGGGVLCAGFIAIVCDQLVVCACVCNSNVFVHVDVHVEGRQRLLLVLSSNCFSEYCCCCWPCCWAYCSICPNPAQQGCALLYLPACPKPCCGCQHNALLRMPALTPAASARR